MDHAPGESESVSWMLSTFPNAVRTGWDGPSYMGHLVGGGDEIMKTKYQTKQKQVKERKLKRKKKKCSYRQRQTGRTDEHGNVGILSQNGCWKAKMSNNNLLKSDLLFWNAPLGRVRLLNYYQEVYVTGKTTNLIWFPCFWKFNWTHLHIILVPQRSPDQGNRWTPDN